MASVAVPRPRSTSCPEHPERNPLVVLFALVPLESRTEVGNPRSGELQSAPAMADAGRALCASERSPGRACSPLPACPATWAGPLASPVCEWAKERGRAEVEKGRKRKASWAESYPRPKLLSLRARSPKLPKKSLFRPPELSRKLQSTPCH